MSMGCSTMTDLKINDRDIAEINGFWAYQNTRNKEFTVNGKTFKAVSYTHLTLPTNREV